MAKKTPQLLNVFDVTGYWCSFLLLYFCSVAMYKNAVLNALVHRNHSDIYPKL